MNSDDIPNVNLYHRGEGMFGKSKKKQYVPKIGEKNVGCVWENHQNVFHELNWNQKIGRNVLEEKSELQKVFSKRRGNQQDESGFIKNGEFLNKFKIITGMNNDNGSDNDNMVDKNKSNIKNNNSEFHKIYSKITSNTKCY
ncbi:unnamed protein product [Gordionus sp. m RMFG-2023]|uniref:uncharacterized protein LOC135929487 n=1 Tax=Gordionus sp. m RMFG-2023 TaxID=3053472 RepID=UPI0031FCCE0F